MNSRDILLPQTIIITRRGETLDAALMAGTFPSMRDERDEPGTREDATSRLDGNRYYGSSEGGHPVPQFTDSYPDPIHILHRSGFFGGDNTIEVIQVTRTPMSPPVAEAFIDAMAEDPAHPFVQAHIMPGIELNGSDSYLSVDGPALAIPLTRLDEDANARRRKDYVAPKPDGKVRSLEVHVTAWDGLVNEDFLTAVRRHESLSPTEIVIGTPEMEDLVPLQHAVGGGSLTGNERAMFKLLDDGRNAGFFETADDARAAIEKALEGVSYTGPHYVSDRNYRSQWSHSFAIEGCVVEDGVEVRRKVESTLVEATAKVRAMVARVAPGRGGDVVGWMFVWQARNWHRGGTMLRQELDDAGAVVRQYRENY